MNASEGRLKSERGLAKIALLLLAAAITLVFVNNRGSEASPVQTTESELQTDTNAQRMLAEGKNTFRFDTFGDEAFWSGVSARGSRTGMITVPRS